MHQSWWRAPWGSHWQESKTQEQITSAKHTWAYLLERREEGTCDGVEPGGAGARILPAMTRLLPAYMRKYAASLAVIASRPWAIGNLVSLRLVYFSAHLKGTQQRISQFVNACKKKMEWPKWQQHLNEHNQADKYINMLNEKNCYGCWELMQCIH